jgi:hypothetical protein
MLSVRRARALFCRCRLARASVAVSQFLKTAPSLDDRWRADTRRAIGEGTVGRQGAVLPLRPDILARRRRSRLRRLADSGGPGDQRLHTQARDLTSKLANDDRDEDREGVYGFDSRAARARQFAAEAGLTAYALMAAAEGAVDAYTHITGDKWKPYEPPVAGPATVGRQAAEAEIAAFG